MKLKIIIILILLNILIPIKSYAEILSDSKFESISIDEGLSNEYVTSIFQDSKGYMWIGTKDGLNRYDGENIKIYNCKTEDKNTLSSTYITDVEEDSDGNLWIATDYGLDFLVADTDSIVRMKDLENDKYNLGSLKITSLLKSNYDENIMWVGTEDGLIRIDIASEKAEAFYHDKNDSNSLTNSSITDLEEGENGTLWVGTKHGINVIYKNFKVNRNKNELYTNDLFIYRISRDNSGNVWISTKEGIIVYNKKEYEKGFVWIIDDVIKEYDINKKKISNVYDTGYSEIELNNNFIFNDSKNNAWLSSSSGVVKIQADEYKIEKIKKNSNLKNSISSNVITCFYEDSNETMWIGTDKGANILNDDIPLNYVNKEQGKDIVSIVQQNNYIWVATKFNGIYIYDSENGNLVKRMYEESDFNLSNRYIKSLYNIHDKYIVIVTNKEIKYIDTEENTYEEVLVEDGYNGELNYLYENGKYIWVATAKDFYCTEIDDGKRVYYSEYMKELGINPGRIKYILQDYKDENIIWLGGIDVGLIKFHKDKGVIERYTNDPSNKNSLINNYINCMIFDNKGNLWIGSNIGLSKFDIKANRFTSYTTAEGLTNNFINSILISDNGNIWISTNEGLNKFDVKKQDFINFTQKDGLYGCQFNLNSSLKLENGNMIFGSTDGYTYFDPDDIKNYKKIDNEVVIGDIFIGEDKVFYDGNELILGYKDKDLSINYFLPNYENINHITYEYMLEGIDSDWQYADSRSRIDFKSLESGKYTLKIRARGAHGELTKGISMNIRVKNPIWKTPLAYLIYIFMTLALFIYIFNYVKILQHLADQKTMKLNKQLEENKKLSKEIIEHEKFKNNYFVNLSHELRTPINIIVSTIQLINSFGSNLTYEKINQYMNIISKNCDNLLKIINDIIDSSKIETGKYKIHKKNNDIVYIVEEAALNMSKFIEENGLILIIDPDIEEKTISCDETEIQRCIVNLLANAIKFTGEGGEIRVYIKEVENNIEITVEDTGIGISKEDQEFIFKRFSQVEGTGPINVSSSGIGLTLVKYIAELHGGDIRLESELNKGSKFTIILPDILENIEANKNI